jgi:hypothetical protein
MHPQLVSDAGAERRPMFRAWLPAELRKRPPVDSAARSQASARTVREALVPEAVSLASMVADL